MIMMMLARLVFDAKKWIPFQDMPSLCFHAKLKVLRGEPGVGGGVAGFFHMPLPASKACGGLFFQGETSGSNNEWRER